MRKGIAILFTAAFALSLAANAAPSGKSRNMSVVSTTGEIQIMLPDGSLKGYPAGKRIPKIPPGAKVKVVSGTAIFTVGSVTVTVEQGDQFSFTLDQGKINVTGLAGTVQVTSGGKSVTLAKGQAAAVPLEPVIAKKPGGNKGGDKGGKKGDKKGDGETGGGGGTPPNNPNAEEGVDSQSFSVTTCVPDTVTPIGPDICTTTYL